MAPVSRAESQRAILTIIVTSILLQGHRRAAVFQLMEIACDIALVRSIIGRIGCRMSRYLEHLWTGVGGL